MDVDDRSVPPLPGSTINPSIHTISSISGLSLDQSQDPNSSRAHRRTSRASERESLEEEIKRTVKALRDQVEDERRRADNAERKVREVTAHLKAVNDARLLALREASRAKEEVRLYRMQLDTAQREIYRAQDVISLVDRQRHSAEKEAAQSRTKARQLNETLMVQAAREEAWKLGLQEGLDRGRDLVADNGPYDGEEDDDEYSSQGSRSSSPRRDHRSYNEPRRRSMVAPSQRSRVVSNPPQPSPSPVPVPLPTNPPTAPPHAYPSDNNIRPVSIRSHNVTPSRPPSVYPSENIRPMSMRNVSPSGLPSLRPESFRPTSVRNGPSSRPPSVHPSENIRPISIRTVTPTPRVYNVVVPPDNLIPTLDADMRIRLPPPHEFMQRTPDRASSPALPAMSDASQASQEPLPIPPRTYDEQQQQQHQETRHRRNSSSGSSSLSQLDIINNPYNPNFRTPMSAIQEVNSLYSGSPHMRSEQGEHGIRHHRSMSENSFQQPPRAPSVQVIEDPQGQRRPQSRSSYAGSFQARPTDQYSSRRSVASSAPNIKVQPPSQPSGSNKTDSLWGGESRIGGGSPSSSQRAPLPSGYENRQPAYASSSTSNGMPGGYGADYGQSAPPSQPYVPVAPLQYEYRNPSRNQWYSSNPNHDDDAVSSAMSADSLATPPARHPAPEPDWSGAVASAGHVPIQPASVTSAPVGSSNTAVWNIPERAIGDTMANGQWGVGSKDGRRRS